MQKQTLHELLDHLHAELQRAPSLEEDDRALLHQVQADIRRITESPATESAAALPEPERQETRSRLQEATLRFAASHPKLAAELDGALNMLSNAGL